MWFVELGADPDQHRVDERAQVERFVVAEGDRQQLGTEAVAAVRTVPHDETAVFQGGEQPVQ